MYVMTESLLVHTDFGHDPDDAIALAYLFEHNHVPHMIGITPGHIQQNQSLSGFINTYYHDTFAYPSYYESNKVMWNDKFTTGKHRVFDDNTLLVDISEHPYRNIHVDKALIIGPPTNIGSRLKCNTMFFQGGYSPNSVKPLDKFKDKTAIQSFNPCGAKNDFNELVKSAHITNKYFIGKNVCHGFTKAMLAQYWEPKNKVVKKFWDQLKPNKKMHDVLAAMLMINPNRGIWSQEKPVWHGNKLSTEPTNDNIWTLIGLRSNHD